MNEWPIYLVLAIVLTTAVFFITLEKVSTKESGGVEAEFHPDASSVCYYHDGEPFDCEPMAEFGTQGVDPANIPGAGS